jgi:hypothetical protein
MAVAVTVVVPMVMLVTGAMLVARRVRCAGVPMRKATVVIVSMPMVVIGLIIMLMRVIVIVPLVGVPVAGAGRVVVFVSHGAQPSVPMLRTLLQ